MRFVNDTKATDVYTALGASNCNLAMAHKRGKEIIARETYKGIRIIKSETDPTVVRQLVRSDLKLNWHAINDLDAKEPA